MRFLNIILRIQKTGFLTDLILKNRIRKDNQLILSAYRGDLCKGIDSVSNLRAGAFIRYFSRYALATE